MTSLVKLIKIDVIKLNSQKVRQLKKFYQISYIMILTHLSNTIKKIVGEKFVSWTLQYFYVIQSEIEALFNDFVSCQAICIDCRCLLR